MMGLISSGINGVRVFDLPTGVWENGVAVEAPRVCLVKWRSEWKDKLYQVYVNGYFAGVTVDCGQREMVVQTPSCYERAARVEVFAVEASEADVDFSDGLERGDGDGGRVRLSLLRSQRLPAGAMFEVYFDNGTGVVDYEHPIGGGQVWGCWQDKAGFGLARFGEGDFGYEWAGGVGFGIGGFGLDEFGYDAGLKGPNTTNCHFSIFSTPEKTKAWEKGKAKGDAKAIEAGRKLFERAARNRED